MSLLSPDLRIVLLPGRATLFRSNRLAAAAESGQGLPGALAALEQCVAQVGAKGRAQVSLSHHFVSLFLQDAPPTWLKHAEMRVWLGEQLATPLGSRDGWRLTWQDCPPGHPIPVCAMAEADLQMLQATLARLGLSAATIQPWLDLSWKRRPAALKRASDAWHALLEPGCMTLLRTDKGRLTRIRQRRFTGDAVQALSDLLRREILLGGFAEGGDLWLERASVGGDWQQIGTAWRLHDLGRTTDPAEAMVS